MKPDLTAVTAILADHRRPAEAVRFLAAMMDRVDFGDVRLLNFFQGYPQSNYWVNYEAWKYVTTPFALFLQFDGYIVHPEKWEPDFLNYDYIGAPWPAEWTDHQVGQYGIGNDGFCLKSRRLMNHVAALPWQDEPSDVLVCCRYRAQLEAAGLRFAPREVAARFSVEHVVPETPAQTFGFHGPRGGPRYPVWGEPIFAAK